MKPGTIFCDHEFRFDDGTTSKKYIILLNDGNPGYYIIVKTTSNDNCKGYQFGCQLEDRYPNFFLPCNGCEFPKNTWVELEQYYEYPLNEMLKKHVSKELEHYGILDENITCQLLECVLESEDISMKDREVVQVVFDSFCR